MPPSPNLITDLTFRYMISICHIFGSLHNFYFVLVEIRALIKKSRNSPDFDEEMRVRPFNSAVLSGATDIIAVMRGDGSIKYSAIHVRFGWQSGVFRGGDSVDVHIDGAKISKQMKIGSNGVAYFTHVNDVNEMNKHLLSLNTGNKSVFEICFQPKVTLWGKEITPFISRFITADIKTKLHLWCDTDKVIICDIDGTITRSDAAGHVLYWARKWNIPVLSSIGFTHPHVVQLLNGISQQNYKIMYLTARNIGYANQVRSRRPH
jgi:phosphatidate phosphatase PAH1